MHGGSQNEVAATPDPSRLDLGDLFDIVIKRRRLLLPALGISFAFALGYIVLSPVRYTASLSILVDPRDRVPVGDEAQPMPSAPDPAIVESRMRALTSKAVLRRVIESENLLNDPDAKPGILGGLMEMAGNLIHGPLTPEQRLDRAAETLGKEISTKRAERSYVVDVDVKAKTPDKAVHLGDALIGAYFANESALSADLVKKQTAWLDARVNDLRARVEAAERRAQDYRDKEGIAETEGHTSPEQQLADANAALVSAQGKRADIEARYIQLKAAAAGATSQSIDDAIHSETIAKLRQDYAVAAREEADLRTALGPRHPSYIAAQARLVSTRSQIAQEYSRIVIATERELQAARAAEASATRLVAKLENTTNAVGDRRIELVELEREAATLRATYEKAVTARENVRRDIVDSPVSVVVDPPVAGSAKTSPKTLPALLLALAAAINIWIAWALLAHMRERAQIAKVATPEPAPVAAPTPSAPAIRPVEAPAPAETPAVSPAIAKTPAPSPAPAIAEAIAPSPAPASAEPATQFEGGWFFASIPVLKAAPVTSFRSRRADARALEIGEAARAAGPFGEAIRALLARVEGYFGNREPASRLAIAATTPGAGASTVAVALAHAAADAGYRVLLADCHGVHSPFGDAKADGGKRRRIEGRDGGEITFLPYPDEHGDFDDAWDQVDAFELILLDCGSLSSASYLINRAKAADAALMVAPASSDRGEIVAELRAARLEHCCAAIALTPIADEARKRAS